MADEHTFTLIFEADGVVTPARPDDENAEPEPETTSVPENEPEPEEAEQ
ncbi:hypothetical protein [Streptomyces canus]